MSTVASILSTIASVGTSTGGILAALSAALYFKHKQPSGHYSPQLAAPKLEESKALDPLRAIQFPRETFVQLLGSFIAETEKLQNSSGRLFPQEDLIADKLIKFLEPYTEPRGPLKVKKCTYVKGRSNVIVHYPSSKTTDKRVSFVGMHMDVVPATPSEWKTNPFQMVQDGDKISGRGVTDCLGHVALFAVIFAELAKARIPLDVNISGVFIANEENSSDAGIGIDELHKQGELEFLKGGPLFWVDSANSNPTMGTGGVQCWKLTATGKGFHSGFPNRGINALSLGMEAIRYIQHRFYMDFPHHNDEPNIKKYNFEIGSSLKPTSVSVPPASLTIIPRECTIQGDVRLTPFYNFSQVHEKVAQYVKDLNEEHIRYGRLPTFGYEKYVLPAEGSQGEALQGLVTFEFTGHGMTGVAVKLDSLGYKALSDSIHHVYGALKPFSLTGSLPIIADLQKAGFDVQIVGFGRMEAYHAVDEFAYISEFEKGTRVALRLIELLNDKL